jgi:Lon protease-like protein
LLEESNSQRSIVRATGVARVRVAKLLKKSAGLLSATALPAPQKKCKKAVGGT